ncbi:MAG: DEAD/DEAH box helicase [Candidatus Omnitrophica bacterium]|nr:DEAD/DEAH box helicase [Candidatus Omnitrophota bacterium]
MIQDTIVDLKEKTLGALGDGGVISQNLSSYEFRPQQLDMARGICDAIESNKHLIVEAGTGIGKSLSYLIPCIYHAVDKDQKIVISTYTKTLQNQLFLKDIPFLKEALGLDFGYALCLGSENYLCPRRLNRDHTYDLFDSGPRLEELRRLVRWSTESESGIRSDLDFMPSEGLWDGVCRDPDLCMGKKCSYRKGCFYKKAKEKQKRSHILITNHSLFFTNLASGGRVLPDFDAVVFDEAQTLEDVATGYLGIEISNARIKYLLDSIYNPRKKKGILVKLRTTGRQEVDHIEADLEDARKASDRFFLEISVIFGQESSSKRIVTKNIVFNHLEEPLKRLASSLSEVLDHVKEDDDRVLVKVCCKRCLALSKAASFILKQTQRDFVYWIDISRKRRGTRYALFAAPIEIADEMEKRLFSKISPIIMTSATLSTNRNFNFIKERLGIRNASEVMVESPFNYEENVLLYIPKDIADPNEAFSVFQRDVAGHIRKIIDIMKGRIFILFTSYSMLYNIYDDLVLNYKNINFLRQGDKPRYALLEDFKKNENSVLLGTSTFWQGVDVPGKSLECVMITRLPFSVPDDPVTEARMELIESRGENPFVKYQVPQATMMFKQGFGRLIRSKTDRGVVAILDPRIRTRYYGRSFINALPRCRHTFDIGKVRDFFNYYLDE